MTETPADTARVSATFDGEAIAAEPGASVAAALIGNGRTAWRSTRSGEPRGLFCGIGVCFDCLVEIDGESGQRACMIPLEPGMRICSAATSAADPTATAPSAAPNVAPSAALEGEES